MTHIVPVLIAGTPENLDEYETYMLAKLIGTRYPNQSGHFMQPNMRSVKFFRISVPVDCEEAFLNDLKPYIGGSGGEIKQKIYFLTKLLGKAIGLEPVPPNNSLSSLGAGWRSALNVLVLGKEVKE